MYIINICGVLEKLNLYIGGSSFKTTENLQHFRSSVEYPWPCQKGLPQRYLPSTQLYTTPSPGTHNGRPYKHMGH